MKRNHAASINSAIEIFAESIKKEYSVLETRLKEPGQQYIALPDRPSIADIAILPFANEKVARTADIDLNEYPSLKLWSEKLLNMSEVLAAFARISTFDHESVS